MKKKKKKVSNLVIYFITLYSPTLFENPQHFFKACGQIPHFFQILEKTLC